MTEWLLLLNIYECFEVYTLITNMAARAGAFSMHVYRRGQIRPQEEPEDELDLTYPIVAPSTVPDGKFFRLPEMEIIPGYEKIGFDSDFCPPPQQSASEIQYKQPSFKNIEHITEDRAKEALINHIEHKHWSKKAVDKMWLKRVEPATSYQYTLETFSEGRTAKWKSSPYREGETINGPGSKNVIPPWDIPAKPKTMFKNEVVHLIVPHTEIVKGCYMCNESGYLRCSYCVGRGKLRCGKCQGKGIRKREIDQDKFKYLKCDPCGGEGKTDCEFCEGSGQEKCETCDGTQHLKWHISLTVTWKVHTADHLIERTPLPDELVSRVPGSICFEDTRPKLLPLINFPDLEVNNTSRKFIIQHRFSNEKILMQKHRIRAVPVTQCKCKYKSDDFLFIVYGLSNDVYCPDYPTKCGCTIL